MTDFTQDLRNQLDPLFERVINALDAADNAHPMAFFTLLRIQLSNAEEDTDVLQIFFDLSTTAFQGFVFSADEARIVDALLAACENVSHTMTAPEHRLH